jgi:serine/threonine protein phosphatase 1
MAVWVTTDLHGNYDLWTQIKNFLKEEDTLIFLGDAIDRGSRGFEIFMEMLEHPQVVYLRGNHEEMMADAYLLVEDSAKLLKHWLKNGGGATKKNINSLNLDWQTKKDFMEKVYKLPCYAEYENEMGIKFILCHAGYTPGEFYEKQDKWQKEQYMLWSRDHWKLPWPKDPEFDNVVIVHGHTPILLMKQLDGAPQGDGCSPFWYENNHKLNLDAATANTGIAFLFNLDTLDWEYFLATPDFVE